MDRPTMQPQFVDLVADIERFFRENVPQVIGQLVISFVVDDEQDKVRAVPCNLELEENFDVVFPDKTKRPVKFNRPSVCDSKGCEGWSEGELIDFRRQCLDWSNDGLLGAAGYLDLGCVHAWLGDIIEARAAWEEGKALAAGNKALLDKLDSNLDALKDEPDPPLLSLLSLLSGRFISDLPRELQKQIRKAG